MSQEKSVAVVGATGAVGIEMLECLAGRNFPIKNLRLLASSRSAGKKLPFSGHEITVEELTPDSFADIDIALFSAGSGISHEFAPHAAKAGAVVIDNSSAFRLDSDVPLIVPEINPEDAKLAVDGRRIIANPNCTTIVSLMALNPLHRAFGGIKNVIAASYQAVSGSGAQGIAELKTQCDLLTGDENATVKKNVYPHQIAFNVIPQVDAFTDNGYTKEEMKFQNESRKILHAPGLRASVTCVRVPVYRSHSVAITAQFENVPDVANARSAIENSPGVRVVDNPAESLYPTPLDTTGKDDCLVGRIREDIVLENALTLWVVGDQVRKGAALNAVQIAELL